MLTAVQGYYDGKQIVVNENGRRNFVVGDKLIITVLGRNNEPKTETRTEKRRRLIDSDALVISTERTALEIDDYIKEMRVNDRV